MKFEMNLTEDNIGVNEIKGFPLWTLVFTICEILFSFLFLTNMREFLTVRGLIPVAECFMLIMAVCIAAAWAIIIKFRIYTTDSFFFSPDFPLSVIAVYMTMIKYFGKPAADFHEWFDTLNVTGEETPVSMSDMLNIAGGFPLMFDFEFYMYIIMTAITVLFIHSRERSIKETIALTLIHPMFILMLFRLNFDGVYTMVQSMITAGNFYYYDTAGNNSLASILFLLTGGFMIWIIRYIIHKMKI